MTPLFFRGSILIAKGIISFSEFKNMRYKDFQRIEATYRFLGEMEADAVERSKRNQKNKETAQKLSNLEPQKMEDIPNLGEDAMEFIKRKTKDS